MSHVRRIAKITTKTITLIGAAGFIVLTAFYCTPLNPLKMRLSDSVSRLFSGYFSQNWRLFAPEPLAANDDFHVRCISGPALSAAGDVSSDNSPSTPSSSLADKGNDGDWRDVTRPLWNAFHRHRLSSYDRLARPINTAIRRYVSGDEGVRPYIQDCQRGEKAACDRVDAAMSAAKNQTRVFLARIASAYCADVNPSKSLSHVALRIVRRPANPWSKRFDGPAPSIYEELGTFPFDTEVVAPGIYGSQVGAP
jgi:hypothetical protein